MPSRSDGVALCRVISLPLLPEVQKVLQRRQSPVEDCFAEARGQFATDVAIHVLRCHFGYRLLAPAEEELHVMGIVPGCAPSGVAPVQIALKASRLTPYEKIRGFSELITYVYG